MRIRILLALCFIASLALLVPAQQAPVTVTQGAAVQQLFGGCTSNTPTGTQYCPVTGRLSTATSVVGNQFVTGRGMTFTGITIALINAEGGSATLTATLAYCTTTACGSTPTTTAVTCVAGNGSYGNTCGGFNAYLPAGTPIAVQTVQSGTGTASTSSFTLTYQ